jgi:hypothetical protein
MWNVSYYSNKILKAEEELRCKDSYYFSDKIHLKMIGTV